MPTDLKPDPDDIEARGIRVDNRHRHGGVAGRQGVRQQSSAWIAPPNTNQSRHHGINVMTPDRWLENRLKFEQPGMPQALRKMSKPFQDDTIYSYRMLHGPGSTEGLAALHRVDMVAGGDYWDIAGMGDANVNSSMGPSWNGSGRVQRLKAHALEQQENGCASVMVMLSSSPTCVDTM